MHRYHHAPACCHLDLNSPRPTQTFGHMVSAAMYEKRFGSYFAAPVIAGLEENGTPYLCGMDSIGAMVRKSFGGS